MRLFWLTLVFVTGIMFPVAAEADSLLPGGDYPAPDCRAPMRPLPGDGRTEWTLYRSDMARYRQCVEAYLNTGRQDVARIHKQMDRVVREYNEASGN